MTTLNMDVDLTPEQAQLRAECIRDAGRIYASILADPVRAAEIREHMARYDATQPVSRS